MYVLWEILDCHNKYFILELPHKYINKKTIRMHINSGIALFQYF